MRIMFVCHGNICRSPMAEFIFRDLLLRNGLDTKVTVASSATSTEEIWNGIGNPIYPPAQRELRLHGITGFEQKRAVQLTRADYDRYDLFIGMDTKNIRNMHAIFGADPDKKIKKLMEYTNSASDVSDPWYSDRFDIAYRDIEQGCLALLEHILSKNTQKGDKT